MKPVACKDHRLGKAKKKKRKRGKLAEGAGTPRSGEKALVGVHANEIGSGDEERTRTVTDTPIRYVEATRCATALLFVAVCSLIEAITVRMNEVLCSNAIYPDIFFVYFMMVS